MTQQLMESKVVSFQKLDKQIESILCDIVIDSPSTWEGIKFKTKDSRVVAFHDSHDVDIKIKHMAINSTLENATFIKKSSIINFTHKFSASNESYEFEVIPEYIYSVIEKRKSTHNENSTLTFYINDAPLIAPHMQFESSREGTLNYKKSNCLTVDVDEKTKITSDVLFNVTHENNNKTIEFNRYHILKTIILEKTCDIDKVNEEYLNKVDKLNDIASLAHGRKVLCTCWNFNSPEHSVTFYRSNYKKQSDIQLNHHQAIIPKNLMENYFQKTYDAYINSPYFDSLRLAINTLTIEKSFLEQKYLSLFQAYESFLLTFKKINNFELILPNKTFSRFRTEIQKNIDASVIPDKDARRKMKSKIGELNRPSLNDIANEFFKEMNVNNKDLWPIFNDGNGVTLSDLRNIIIHGEILPKNSFQNIFVAQEHLKLHLFRLIFTVLDWDVNKTNISEQKIKASSNLTDEKYYIESREELTKALEAKK